MTGTAPRATPRRTLQQGARSECAWPFAWSHVRDLAAAHACRRCSKRTSVYFAVELPVGEHRPRRKAPPPCNGRGTLGSPLTARPGMYSPRHSFTGYPAAHRHSKTRIGRNLAAAKLQPSRKSTTFPCSEGRNHPSSQGCQVRGVLYRGFRVKLGLSLLLLSSSSHITDLLLGNLGNGLGSQARVGEPPAKVTLANLAGLGRSGALRQ